MGMLLPAVQAHLRLPSMTELLLKHRSLIALFLRNVIREFSVFSSAATTIISFAVTTVTHAFSSSALLSTPPSPSPILLMPTTDTCFDHQPLPPLLPTPSPFFLWHMLSTKSKFSIDLVPIANHDTSSEFISSFASTESASSFTSHLYKSHE